MRDTPHSATAQEATSSSAITSTPAASRRVTDVIVRDEWIRGVAAIKRLTPILRVVGMRLGHHFGKAGKVNPSYATLAAECETSERTTQRAVAKLRALGWIAPAQNGGGSHNATNDFVLLIPTARVSSQSPVKAKSRRLTGVQRDTARVTSGVFDGCLASHPNSSKRNDRRGITERGFAARSEYVDRVHVTETEIFDPEKLPELPQGETIEAAVLPTTQTDSAPFGAIGELKAEQIESPIAGLLPESGSPGVTRAPDLDDGAAGAHVLRNDNEEDDTMPIEMTDWRTKKNFWELNRVYMRNQRGDPDRAFEAYTVALADGHSHAEIMIAATRMTCSAIGKGGQCSHIPELAKFLTDLPVVVVPLRPEIGSRVA